MTKPLRFADVDFVQVKCKSGVVYSLQLVHENGSTIELHGMLMYRWLDEWQQHWRTPPDAVKTPFSSPISYLFGRRRSGASSSRKIFRPEG